MINKIFIFVLCILFSFYSCEKKTKNIPILIENRTNVAIDSLVIGLSYEKTKFGSIPKNSIKELIFKFDLSSDTIKGDEVFFIEYYQNGDLKHSVFEYNLGINDTKDSYRLYIDRNGVNQKDKDS